jgi:enamine deaminase RidA (YjgF/YER057c/UK114 family)
LSIENRLKELDITLPEPPAPVAAYVPVVQTGNLVFVSGQGPVSEGKPAYVGRLGAEYDVAQGQAAARLAMINCIAQLKAHLGTLDRVRQIVKVLGFVASTDDFDQQPFVINGASEMLEQVFGESGRHARSAVGTNKLPFNIPVEIELIAEVE